MMVSGPTWRQLAGAQCDENAGLGKLADEGVMLRDPIKIWWCARSRQGRTWCVILHLAEVWENGTRSGSNPVASVRFTNGQSKGA